MAATNRAFLPHAHTLEIKVHARQLRAASGVELAGLSDQAPYASALRPFAHQSLCHKKADEAEDSSDSLPCACISHILLLYNPHNSPELAPFYQGENRHRVGMA